MRQEQFTMTQLRREFGVTARTLRFYEDKGLLHPSRDGQSRIFSYRDRARLELVLRGKRVGFSLAEIKEMLDLYNLKDGQVTQLRVSLEKANERIGILEQQKHEIEETIGDLTRTRDVIRGMLTAREAQERSCRHDPDAA
jgi:DNA-binding transcriptional MerR regulator